MNFQFAVWWKNEIVNWRKITTFKSPILIIRLTFQDLVLIAVAASQSLCWTVIVVGWAEERVWQLVQLLHNHTLIWNKMFQLCSHWHNQMQSYQVLHTFSRRLHSTARNGTPWVLWVTQHCLLMSYKKLPRMAKTISRNFLTFFEFSYL